MQALAGKVKFQPRMCSLSSCYCRLKLSQPMPTVHILPKQGNQAKANIEPIVFWVTPLHQLTPVSCRQLVGWVSRLLHQVLPHKFSHPLSPRYTSSAVRRKKRVGKNSWQRAPASNPNTWTWSWNVHATLTYKHTPAYIHICSMRTCKRTLFLCSSFTL